MIDLASRRARRVMVVTGVAGLIGRGIADVLTERGVDVVGVDVAAPDEDASRRWSRMIRVDVADTPTMQDAAASVREACGGIDAIVHAAAITGRSAELHSHTLRTVDLDLWRRVLEVNVTGSLVCAREFGPLLRTGPLAQILMVGSIQGLVPTDGSSAYAVSKAALVGLVRQLAAEMAADGVRVNLVAPGPVADQDELARLRSNGLESSPTPLGRFCTPREMAEAIADLATGAFGFLTGATIPLDGGEHLRPRTGPARAHHAADTGPNP